MSQKLIRYEPLLYLAAVLVAVGFRLINLASLPLSDGESAQALNAFHLVTDSHIVGGNQPLYTLFTGILFFIFGSSDFLARLIPAVAGCLLVLLPVLIRDDLGRLPAIILSFGLAMDPALVALSRQAGSVMPALVLTMAAACYAWKRNDHLAALFCGLAILAGTPFWFGIVGILLTVLSVNLFRSRATSDAKESPDNVGKASIPGYVGLTRRYWPILVVTILLGGSLFAIFPSGLSAVIDGLLSYFKGWYTVGDGSIRRILVALLIYQMIPLLTGLAEGISGVIQKQPYRKEALIAFLVFLFLTVLYPGRQMGDMVWSIVFLWLMSAWLLSRLAETPDEALVPMLGHAALVTTLLIFVILNITWVLGGFGGLDVTRSLSILGGVVVIFIISFLVAYGWGVAVAVRGALLGVGLVGLVVMVSFSVSAGGLNSRSVPDLWRQDARVTGVAALGNDLDEFSVWGTGVRNSLSITVINFDTPSLHWYLRNYPKTIFEDTLATAIASQIVITDHVYRPELSSNYRGETFAWYTTADWSTMNTLGILDWIFHKKAYESPTNLIFWVRQDLFVSGGQSLNQ